MGLTGLNGLTGLILTGVVVVVDHLRLAPSRLVMNLIILLPKYVVQAVVQMVNIAVMIFSAVVLGVVVVVALVTMSMHHSILLLLLLLLRRPITSL